MGIVALLLSNFIRGIKIGLLPIGVMFSPVLRFISIVFFVGAVVGWFKSYGKSVLEKTLRRLTNSEAAPVQTASRWRENPHTTETFFLSTEPRYGEKATVVGESGAWIDIAEKLQRQGLNIRKIEEIEPHLSNIRAAYKPSVDRFHRDTAAQISIKKTSGSRNYGRSPGP